MNAFEQKYEYIKIYPISRGSYSNIYHIRDKKVKKEYVLKKIRKEDPKKPNESGTTDENTFRNEKDFLINVKGTNLVNIVDYYDNIDEKFYYIILEKMDNDLTAMLEDYNKGMPSKLIRKIFSQINSGLKIMINHGKVHFDLKPENILFSYINDEKSDFLVKISDFGLTTDLTRTETVYDEVTDIFKAPEIEEGKYTNKCNLYSIGIILYLLKTGECIFEGKKKAEILKNKFNNEIKKETDDILLNELIKKLVVIDPHERMEWNDYFNDPFFRVNDDDIKESEECKIDI